MPEEKITDKRVVVVSGGWSDEREIALTSGRACQKALTEAGFSNVELVDIAKDGSVERLCKKDYDVAFIAMHGAYGEDGCVQGMFEVLHIPYTFSNVLASAMGTAKEISKTIYQEAGLPTPLGKTVAANQEFTDDELKEIVDELKLPLFVKPSANGSSYGISRVQELGQLRKAIKEAQASGSSVLIEEEIKGTEITVPVVGNEDPQALPIIEIVTGAEFYDLKVKYEPSELHHVIPARLDENTYKRAQEYAVQAHKALGCRGCSRSDFIVKADSTVVILETNTIPGMTETSLLPDAARHAGISFADLCKRFVELALEA